MSRVRIVLCAVGCIMPFVSTAHAQSRPDTVSLRFGWPVGMTAVVDQEWTRMELRPGRRDSVTVKSRYRMTVREHPRGRAIHSDSFSLAVQPGALSRGTTQELQQFLTRLGSVQPSYVVSTEGDFLEVQGVDETRRTMESVLAPMLRGMAQAPPAFKTMMQSLLSAESLTNAAAGEWNVLAGAWVGADLEIGDIYGLTAEEPFPLLPGLSIPMAYEFRVAERVPCHAAESAKRCVRLEMFSEPDSAGLRQVITKFISALAPKDANVAGALEDIRVGSELTLVADPVDLRPHSLMLTKVVDVAGSDSPRQPASAMRRVEIRSVRYTYPP